MKRIITAIALLLATMPAMAMLDNQCMYECRAKFSYGYCLKVCEY